MHSQLSDQFELVDNLLELSREQTALLRQVLSRVPMVVLDQTSQVKENSDDKIQFSTGPATVPNFTRTTNNQLPKLRLSPPISTSAALLTPAEASSSRTFLPVPPVATTAAVQVPNKRAHSPDRANAQDRATENKRTKLEEPPVFYNKYSRQVLIQFYSEGMRHGAPEWTWITIENSSKTTELRLRVHKNGRPFRIQELDQNMLFERGGKDVVHYHMVGHRGEKKKIWRAIFFDEKSATHLESCMRIYRFTRPSSD